MSEYPEDVIIAAREANASVYERQGQHKSARQYRRGELDGTPLMIGTCDAILAERERCAAIASGRDEDGTPYYLDGDEIADAIGSPQKKPHRYSPDLEAGGTDCRVCGHVYEDHKGAGQ